MIILLNKIIYSLQVIGTLSVYCGTVYLLGTLKIKFKLYPSPDPFPKWMLSDILLLGKKLALS